MKTSVTLAAILLTVASCKKSGPDDAGGTSAGTPPTAAPQPAPDSTPADADAILSAYLGGLETLSGLFKQVQDEESAKKHAPEIKATSSRLQELAGKMKSIDPMKRGISFAAQGARLAKIQQEMSPELLRIAGNPALAKHLGDSLKLPRMH